MRHPVACSNLFVTLGDNEEVSGKLGARYRGERGGRGERGYDAFISYSHRLDAAITARLQAELQRFAKPWYRIRALHVFRDQTSLAASPHLWTTIEEALADSSWLILMASPEWPSRAGCPGRSPGGGPTGR